MMKSRYGTLVSFASLVILLMLLSVVSVAYLQEATEQANTFRNPLNVNGGADPWLTYYDGNYYLAATTWSSILTMRRSPTLEGLKTARPERIYFETEPSRCCNMWAPEFHLLDGPNGLRWYFYYTAGTAGPTTNQHSHVLESAGTDPMGPYTYKGRLYNPDHDVWAIDGSVLQLDGALYFLYSEWVGDNQSILIAPMSNPWILAGAGVVISQPQYEWERIGLNVNEAPVALYHDDQTFIIYSASFCATPDYKLGMLTYNGGDPLSPDSWDKHPEPVFQRSDENGVFGPGHNGFFQSPDGTENWIVYHANDSAQGVCDMNRMTRAQPFTWNEDGTPNFGVPASDDTELPVPSGEAGGDVIDAPPLVVSRFESLGMPDAYLRHSNFSLRLDYNVNPITDSQFVMVEGLADPAAVSLEAVNYPGFYVRHTGNLLSLSLDDGSETFAADATWWVRPGLADSAAISFEAYNQSGGYIGRMIGITALVAITDASPALALQDATFIEVRE